MEKLPYKRSGLSAGDNLLAFCCLGASEIWPDRGLRFGGSSLITVCVKNILTN